MTNTIMVALCPDIHGLVPAYDALQPGNNAAFFVTNFHFRAFVFVYFVMFCVKRFVYIHNRECEIIRFIFGTPNFMTKEKANLLQSYFVFGFVREEK